MVRPRKLGDANLVTIWTAFLWVLSHRPPG